MSAYSAGTQFRISSLKVFHNTHNENGKDVTVTLPGKEIIHVKLNQESTIDKVIDTTSGKTPKIELNGVKRGGLGGMVGKGVTFELKNIRAGEFSFSAKEYTLELVITKDDGRRATPAYAGAPTNAASPLPPLPQTQIPSNPNPLSASSSSAGNPGMMASPYSFAEAANYPSQYVPYPAQVQNQLASMQFSPAPVHHMQQMQMQMNQPQPQPQQVQPQPGYNQFSPQMQHYAPAPLPQQPLQQQQQQPQYFAPPGQQQQQQQFQAPLQAPAPAPEVNNNRIRKVMINRSEITFEKKIGSGAFGEVWKGKWQYRDVAIKKIQSTQITQEEMDDFLQEIHSMRKLKHPNILIAWGAVTDGESCLVTEYMDKGSLFHVIADQTSAFHTDWSLRSHIALSAAIGMNYLHSRSPPVIHRDIKSLNILINKHWEAKLADFGLTRQKASASLSTKCGSPHWSAPEVLNSEPYNEKADIYSFGVMLWEIIAASPPYKGMDAVQVITKVIRGERMAVPNQFSDPPYLEFTRLMQACWDQNPDRRPNSKQVVEILQSIHAQYEERKQSPALNPSLSSNPLSASTPPLRANALPPQSPCYAQPISPYPQQQQQPPLQQQFPLYAQPAAPQQYVQPAYPPQAYPQPQQQQQQQPQFYIPPAQPHLQQQAFSISPQQPHLQQQQQQFAQQQQLQQQQLQQQQQQQQQQAARQVSSGSPLPTSSNPSPLAVSGSALNFSYNGQEPIN